MNVQFKAPSIEHSYEIEGKGNASVKISSKSPFGIDIVISFQNGKTKVSARYLLSVGQIRLMRRNNEYKLRPKQQEIEDREKSLQNLINDPLTLQCIHGYFGKSA
jgi:hypothetical protein